MAILGTAVPANILATSLSDGEETLPWLGLALWVAILVTSLIATPDWSGIRRASKGAIFLVALVLAASLMPVTALPEPSWQSAFGLGLLSSVFDNIPLTVLALEQGGYDWALLAYAVGFGGSMIWFGSSAGVAISNNFPEARSVGAWVRNGWHVAVGYVLGFFVLLAVLGWHAQPKRGEPPPQRTSAVRGVDTAMQGRPAGDFRVPSLALAPCQRLGLPSDSRA